MSLRTLAAPCALPSAAAAAPAFAHEPPVWVDYANTLSAPGYRLLSLNLGLDVGLGLAW